MSKSFTLDIRVVKRLPRCHRLSTEEPSPWVWPLLTWLLVGVLSCWSLAHLCGVEKFCSVNYVNYIVTIAQQRFYHRLSSQWFNVEKFSVLCRCSLRNCFSYTLCLSTSLYRALTLYLTKPLNKQFMFHQFVYILVSMKYSPERRILPYFSSIFRL